jgi:hypothetical protein
VVVISYSPLLPGKSPSARRDLAKVLINNKFYILFNAILAIKANIES